MDESRCLVELSEVLKHLTLEDLNKIPYDIKGAIEKGKDKNYIWEYDASKKLDEQSLNRKTIAMLSYLNMKYLLNDEQRRLMESYHMLNENKKRQKASEENKQMNGNYFFKQQEVNVINSEKENFALEVKKETFLGKILNFIKRIMRR